VKNAIPFLSAKDRAFGEVRNRVSKWKGHENSSRMASSFAANDRPVGTPNARSS
jgi:hypothetical protein